jgi:hypothetical protein
MLRPESWAVIAVALFGMIAAGFAYARTPADQRNRMPPRNLEARLAACPPEARAVIVRADRRRALRRDLPWLLLSVPMAAFAIWLQATHGNQCASLLGVTRLQLLVWSFFTVMPALLLFACVASARQALAVLRGGYWPPLDMPQYVDTLAIGGRVARLRAISLLVVIVLAVAMMAYGYVRLEQFPGVRKLLAAADASTAGCAAGR